MTKAKKTIYYLSNSSQKTQKLAKEIAKEILLKKCFLKIKEALIIKLRGELGAGKTTFLKGFAAGIGIKDKILSPTFVIIKRFPLKNIYFENFFHIDCYRLENTQDAKSIDLKKILKERKNIVAIEWPDKIKDLLNGKSITIDIKFNNRNKKNNNSRQIFISFNF